MNTTFKGTTSHAIGSKKINERRIPVISSADQTFDLKLETIIHFWHLNDLQNKQGNQLLCPVCYILFESH